jgi:hypothetical protein
MLKINSMKKFFLLSLSLLILACGDNTERASSTGETGDTGAPLFERLSPQKTGLTFRNDLDEDIYSFNNILFFEYYYSGGGVAVGDVNNDGLPDVFLSGNTSPNRLFLNKGNMQFEDITEKAGVNQNKVWSTGVTMADVNNDGWLDIYVCQGGLNRDDKSKRRNLLFINKRDLTFSEQASTFGLDDTNLSTQASFFDYDKDGDLDCFIMNESEYFRIDYGVIEKEILPFEDRLRAQSNRFFENQNGKFVDKTKEAGLLNYSFGLGLVTVDINQDGWTDIYVGNDYSVPDFLYINNGNGTFSESVKKYTKHTSWFTMGVDIADFTNDGHPDIAAVDMATPDHFRSKVNMASMDVDFFWYNIRKLNRHYGYMFNALQVNNGNNTFSNVADFAGVSKTEWSWASLLADFDNDGLKDYFVSNGNRRNYQHNDIRKKLRELKATLKNPVGHPEVVKIYESFPEIKLPNLIYKNEGDLHFKEYTKDWGLDYPTFSNGAAYADLDLDGDLDLIVNNIDDYASLLENQASEQKDYHYLKFEFPTTPLALNARVELEMGNGEVLVQENHPVRGYCSSMDQNLNFGLGKNTLVPKVTITWLNGKQQIMKDVAADQTITLDLAKARNPKEEAPVVMAAVEEIKPASLGLDYRHAENDFDDYSKQVLLPYKHSTLGPALARGDFNGDGIEDIFLGGASGQAGSVWLQNSAGNFSAGHVFSAEAAAEDVGAVALDAEGDGDLDLYVVSGGYEMNEADALLADRLYLNDGKSNFVKAGGEVLPAIQANGNVAIAADIDADGDQDILVGAGVIPGKYPFPDKSFLLRNEGGRFVADESLLSTKDWGIVNDLEWADLNGDSRNDLIVAGEWEKIHIYLNEGGQLSDKTEELIPENPSGWWYSVQTLDIDGDGDLDFLTGNVGQNTKFQTKKEPKLYVFASDFDENGTCDVVLSKTYKGRKVPVRGLQCSSEQMPFIKDKYPTYTEFANAELGEILGEQKLDNSLSKKVETFTSGIWINEKGTFRFHELPAIAQISPVLDCAATDINGDGKPDLVLTGNIYNTEVETPRWDAGNGLILLNQSGVDQPKLKPLTIKESGFCTPEDAKRMTLLSGPNEKERVLVVNNNGPVQLFELKGMSM